MNVSIKYQYPYIEILNICFSQHEAVDADRKCEFFSAAKCLPIKETLIDDVFNGLDEFDCQEYCQLLHKCEYYRFVRDVAPGTRCTLFTEDYRRRCAVYGGNQVSIILYYIHWYKRVLFRLYTYIGFISLQDTELSDCIQKDNLDNTCDLFLQENCQYSGNEVFRAEPGSVIDAFECQEFCKLFESGSTCRYWKFEVAETSPNNGTSCILYDSWDPKSCTSIHGPYEPYHYKCGPKLK